MKAYADYKPSGVEWLGEVPSHWEVCPIRNIFKFRNEKNDPVKTENILSLSIANGVTEYTEENRGGNKRKDDLTAYKLAYPNDIVLNSMNVIVGAVGRSNFFGAISPVYYALYLHKNDDIHFYEYVFSNAYFQRGLLRYGKGILIKKSDSGKLNTIRMKISQDDLKSLFFPRPPLAEQQKIAQFLDTQTAQIDALITEQKELIELLTEQRKAIISHAVTKGLNPNTPMKKSGVEWLREVPSGWEIYQLRHLFSFNKGLTITKENLQENGIPCVNYGEIHSKFGFEVNPQIHQLKCVSENYLQDNLNSLLEYGDFIFADTSEDLEGSGNFTYLNSKIPTFAGYHTIIAKPKNKNLIRFYAYLFHSEPFRKQIRMSVKGIKVFSITQAILKSCFVWLPNEVERNEIINYLDEKTAQIDALITEQKELIERLKEYRTALISAAVTGKIDVQAA